MKRIDPQRTGIYLAILAAFLYSTFALVSLFALLNLPIFRPLDIIVHLDVDFALAAIILTSAIGFALGMALATVWNWALPRLCKSNVSARCTRRS